MKNLFVLTSLFFLVITGFAQEKKITTVEVTDTIVSASVDRPGELYIVTKAGHIQKFDQNGKLISLYKNTSAPTLFEPRDGSHLFAYFRNLQQYWFFNPTFEVVASYALDSAFAIEPWLACPSGEHQLWILDGIDNTLKKIDTRDGTVILDLPSTVKDSKRNVQYMRDYQGFLFLLDRSKGILVFNTIGKLIKTIPGNITYFNFLGEELYYAEGGLLKFFDIFSGETRQQKLSMAKETVLQTDERTFVIYPRQIDIYKAK